MHLIAAVREWFRACPLLRQDTAFQVDMLGADPIEYEIAPLSCNPIVKRYTDGSTIRQFQFAFASREEYGGQRICRILHSMKLCKTGWKNNLTKAICRNCHNGRPRRNCRFFPADTFMTRETVPPSIRWNWCCSIFRTDDI